MILPLICLVGVSHGAGNKFSHGKSLQDLLSEQGVTFYDNGLYQLLDKLYTLEPNDLVLGAAIKHLADNYKEPQVLTYNYFDDYLYSFSFLLIQVLKTPSLAHSGEAHLLFVNLVTRFLADFFEFSPSFSQDEQEQLLARIQKQFFDHVQDCFDSCKGDCLMLCEGEWESYVPYFYKHAQVLADVLYAIEVVDIITYLFEYYHFGALSIDAACAHWQKRMHNAGAEVEMGACQEFSDLSQYIELYLDILLHLIERPFYAYVEQAVMPAFRVWCRDMMSLSCLASHRSVNNFIQESKQKCIEVAHCYAQKKSGLCVGLSKNIDGYNYIAKIHAHQKATKQLLFILKATTLIDKLIFVFQNTKVLASQRMKIWDDIIIHGNKKAEVELEELYTKLSIGFSDYAE